MGDRERESGDRQAAFLSALVTQHFVLQTAANATVSEQGTRASLYVLALSSALVAMGFASRDPEVFVPFVATVLPALFLLGLFTVVRLIDAAMEYNSFLTGIARIRRYYRTLTPEAAAYLSAASGRWPETGTTPALRLGTTIAFATTIASMVAFINSIVAAAGVSLLVGALLGGTWRGLALGLGLIVVVALMTGFYAYQLRRYSTGPGNSVGT
jgi:hypothetical protein